MTHIGLLSLPVLLMSLAFIFLHSRFARLYAAEQNSWAKLRELLLHKLELVVFLIEIEPSVNYFEEGLDGITKALEDCDKALETAELSDEDQDELFDVDCEIQDAKNMYMVSKAELDKFTKRYPGKLFLTVFSGKQLR